MSSLDKATEMCWSTTKDLTVKTLHNLARFPIGVPCWHSISKHYTRIYPYLQPDLDPIQGCRLEELGRFEGSEEIPFLLRFGRSVFQGVYHVVFKQFLVGHSHFDGHSSGTVLPVPGLHKWNVYKYNIMNIALELPTLFTFLCILKLTTSTLRQAWTMINMLHQSSGFWQVQLGNF